MTRAKLISLIQNSLVAKINKHLASEVNVKPAKYRNQKIELDGYTFDSKKESRRYIELRKMQTIGQINCLNCQTPFQLSVCKYIADFTYKNAEGELVVEDVKSKITRRLSTYRLKSKLMKAELGIKIIEL